MTITIERWGKESVALFDGVFVGDVQDALDLMGEATARGAQRMILSGEQLHEDFWDLETGLAGEVLQKFSNYSCALAILADYEFVESKALQDFIRESNETGAVVFRSDRREIARDWGLEI